MLSPWMSGIAIKVCSIMPALPIHFWKLTRAYFSNLNVKDQIGHGLFGRIGRK